MNGEFDSAITIDNIVDIVIPIAVAIITWGMSRIKNPDYGKRDWKCKRSLAPFTLYTIFLIAIFLSPLVIYLCAFLFWQAIVKSILEWFNANVLTLNVLYRIYMVGTMCAIYAFIGKAVWGIKIFFKTKKNEKCAKYSLVALLYFSIIWNFFEGITISVRNDASFYTRTTTIFMIICQIIGGAIINGDSNYDNKNMTIVTKTGERVTVSVENVYKKGKWLRILEQKNPRKEKLILYDDIQSIEYFD